MCRRIEEVEPTVGLPRHRHFLGFFNVPVQTPTRDPPFYGYSEKPPHFSRLLRHVWGYGGHILDLNPRAPTGSVRHNNTHYLYEYYRTNDRPSRLSLYLDDKRTDNHSTCLDNTWTNEQPSCLIHHKCTVTRTDGRFVGRINSKVNKIIIQ